VIIDASLAIKLVAMAMSLGRSQNEWMLNEALPYLYQCWKFGKNQPTRYWDYWARNWPL